MGKETLKYWIILIVGGIFILYGLYGDPHAGMQISLNEENIAVLIVGCFLGIIARMVQAEVHHTENKK